MIQLDLFPPRLTLNRSVAPADRRRLSRHQRLILARLRDGPATGDELHPIARRYGARLEELRRAGCEISKSNKGGGVWEYRLDYCPDGLGGEG